MDPWKAVLPLTWQSLAPETSLSAWTSRQFTVPEWPYSAITHLSVFRFQHLQVGRHNKRSPSQSDLHHHCTITASSLHHHCSSVIIIIVHLLLTWYWHRSWQLPAGVCPDRAAPPESCQHGPSSLRPLLSRTPRKEDAPRGLWSPWPSTTLLCSPSPDEGLPCQTQPDYITCVT